MEIRRIEKSDIPQVREVWLRVFPEDSEEFLDWFLSQIYDCRRAWGVFCEGKLVSMANLANTMLLLREREIPSNFLQGVATLPEYRGKGYSRTLIRALLKELRWEGALVSALTTDIHDFYRPLGYETYSHVQKRKIENGQGLYYRCSLEEVTPMLNKALLAVYRQAMEGINGSISRKEEDMARILKDSLCYGEHTLYLAKGEENAILGYTIAAPQEENLEGLETVWQNEAALSSFAQAAQDMGLKSFVYEEQADTGRERAMIRVLRVKELLESLPLGAGECVVEVHDELFGENTGTWHIFSDGHRTKVTATRADTSVLLSPGQLGALIFGLLPPIQGKPETVQQVYQIFTKQKCGILERY